MALSTGNIPAGIVTAGQNAVQQIVTRVPDLPRPVAALVGAGDMAAERITTLSGEVSEVTEKRRAQLNLPAVPSSDDVKAVAAQLPTKVQGFVGDLPGKVSAFATELPNRARGLAGELPSKAQEFAADLPGKVQGLTSELPGKVQSLAGGAQELAGELPAKVQKFAGERSEGARQAAGSVAQQVGGLTETAQAKAGSLAGQLNTDALVKTAQVYAGILGSVYNELADHGEEVWDRIRGALAANRGATGTGRVLGRGRQAGSQVGQDAEPRPGEVNGQDDDRDQAPRPSDHRQAGRYHQQDSYRPSRCDGQAGHPAGDRADRDRDGRGAPPPSDLIASNPRGHAVRRAPSVAIRVAGPSVTAGRSAAAAHVRWDPWTSSGRSSG